MSDLTAARRSIRGYWFVDGFQEIAGGTAITIVTSLLLASAVSGNRGLADVAFGILMVGAVIVALVVRAAKRKITYARTGQARERTSARFARVVAMLLWVAVAIPLLDTYTHSAAFSAPVVLAATGIAGGLGTAWQAWRTGLRRFYVQGFVLSLTGTIAAAAGLNAATGTALILLMGGLSTVATGCVALNAYLRDNRSSPADEVAS